MVFLFLSPNNLNHEKVLLGSAFLFASLSGFYACKKASDPGKTGEIPKPVPSKTAQRDGPGFDVLVILYTGFSETIDGLYFHCIGGGPSCDADVVITFPQTPLSSDQALGKIEVSNGHYVIKYQKNTLDATIKSTYFVNGTFTLPGTVKLNANTSQALGSSTPIIIPAGQYSYTEDATYLNVVI